MEARGKDYFNGPQNGLKMVKHPSFCQETIYTFFKVFPFFKFRHETISHHKQIRFTKVEEQNYK